MRLTPSLEMGAISQFFVMQQDGELKLKGHWKVINEHMMPVSAPILFVNPILMMTGSVDVVCT